MHGYPLAMGTVRETLELVGAINDRDVELYSSRARDREVSIWRDTKTDVIFIDDFYVGDDEYHSGEYRGDSFNYSLENALDTERRLNDFHHLYAGKRVLDWGCGKGDFLRGIKERTSKVHGVELQEDYKQALETDGIPTSSSLPPGEFFDVCFMFHVLEHLENPITHLTEIKDSLDRENGKLIIEIPHARDFLLSQFDVSEFKEFTLWSQHLVLYTRDSLRRLLEHCGFKVDSIFGVQRYSLANHLHWLKMGRPGGHQTFLGNFDTPELRSEYANSLAKIDATDTLVAIASL